MSKILKNGEIIGIKIDLELLDNLKEFTFKGYLLYVPKTFRGEDTYLTLVTIGRGKIIGDFQSLEIPYIYVGNSEKEAQREDIKDFENYAKNEICSYDGMEILVMQKMNKEREGDNLSFVFNKIQLEKIDLKDINTFEIVGRLSIINLGHKEELVFYDFKSIGRYINNSVIVDSVEIFEIENDKDEKCKLFVNDYLQSNGYIYEYLTDKIKEQEQEIFDN